MTMQNHSGLLARFDTRRHIGVPAASAFVLLLASACESSTGPHPVDRSTPIMFQSVRDAGSGVYLTSDDGHRIVPFDVGNSDARTGDWSPDGTAIVYTRLAPTMQVWLAYADGSHPLQLTHSTGSSSEPRWMPNAAGISYLNNDDPFDWGINAMRVDGANPHRLSNTAKAFGPYSWSADGRVVFARYDAIAVPGTGEYRSVSHLYVADTTQAAPVQLAANDDCGDRDPEWSPDGSKIVFASCSANKSSIVVINPDGTGRVVLTNGDGVDSRPTWSPDGRRIAFQRGTGNSADVWVMSADGTNAVNITRGNPLFDGAPKWNRQLPVPG
jgi:Tol biopolymer transport system component